MTDREMLIARIKAFEELLAELDEKEDGDG